MENASKAIIIGGSVLVAILIVSVGIVIYNSSKNTTGTAASSVASLEVQLYNQKFEKYFQSTGFSYYTISGRDLKSLISEAIASKSDIEIDMHKEYNIPSNLCPASGAKLPSLLPYININKNSAVYPKYDSNGRIESIKIGD